MPRTPTWIRLAFHLLVAVFLANAANKLFIPDLDYEDANKVYAAIFAFDGPAPDQYRILPLLLLKGICLKLPFHHAVLLLNGLAAFICFELFWWLMGEWSDRKKAALILVFAAFHAYAQYTGWRPDTMALVMICTLGILPAGSALRGLPRAVALVLAVAAISFSRADIGMVYAIFFAVYTERSWPVRIFLLLIPPAVQALLQFVLFPDAVYYTHTIMLQDNLSGYYLVKSPATYLILAIILFEFPRIRSFLRDTFPRFKYFYILCAGYLLLILMVGRLNEYRLYLPFVPLWLWLMTDLRKHGGNSKTKETRPLRF